MSNRTKFVVNYTTEDLITGKRTGHWTFVMCPSQYSKMPIHTVKKKLEKAIQSRFDPFLVGVDVIYFVDVEKDEELLSI